MNGKDAVESITDLSDQNPETANKQALSVKCMEAEPQFTGVVLSQEDHGLKRKHCDISADTEIGEKIGRFLDDGRDVTTCERKETNYEFAQLPTKVSATLKASFFDESHLLEHNNIADNEAVGKLPEDGKKGRRRKRGQRKNKSSENLNEAVKPLQQTSMDSRIFENNAHKILIVQQTDALIVQQTADSVTETEESVPNITSVDSKPFSRLTEKLMEKPVQQTSMDSILFENNAQKTQQTEDSVTKIKNGVSDMDSVDSKPFSKLTEIPKPKADKTMCRPSLLKSKPKETANCSKNPKHKETEQLNDKKVVIDLEVQSKEINSKSVPLLSKPKYHNEVFMYGNYSRYYGYRSPELEEDVRLSCFSQSFFEGKEVLDIGCNIGHVTLLIARDWRPKRIVGVDIDGKLINIAKKNVKHYMGQKNLHRVTSKSLSQATSNNGNSFNSDVHPNERFPSNVMFMQGNYVLARDDLVKLQKEEYDVILALSISKWIHLNFGDDGLKRTFQRTYHQLRPGGRFILEPQEWSSYKKKKKLTETIFQNFQNIKFRPDSFRSYLLSDEVGFSSCELLGVPNNKSKGFRRPLLMFIKGLPQNSNESLCTTEQPLIITDECCAVTEKATVESSSQGFVEAANTHVCEKTEDDGSTMPNTPDILITQGARNEDQTVSTQLTDAENVIIHLGDWQSPKRAVVEAVTDEAIVDSNQAHSNLTGFL